MDQNSGLELQGAGPRVTHTVWMTKKAVWMLAKKKAKICTYLN